jgi:hypothetical protein
MSRGRHSTTKRRGRNKAESRQPPSLAILDTVPTDLSPAKAKTHCKAVTDRIVSLSIHPLIMLG